MEFISSLANKGSWLFVCLYCYLDNCDITKNLYSLCPGFLARLSKALCYTNKVTQRARLQPPGRMRSRARDRAQNCTANELINHAYLTRPQWRLNTKGQATSWWTPWQARWVRYPDTGCVVYNKTTTGRTGLLAIYCTPAGWSEAALAWPS